jgi:hypothetical protein
MALPAFTPAAAFLGGLTLGVATVAKYCITGRILGVSGTVKGLLSGEVQPWRLAFTCGLLLAGALARGAMPGAFEQLPAAYTVGRAASCMHARNEHACTINNLALLTSAACSRSRSRSSSRALLLGLLIPPPAPLPQITRAAAAGGLVGFGAALGSGCTSGHGICGNARLSLRSAAATATFMASGIATATLTGALGSSGLAAALPPAAAALPPVAAARAMPLQELQQGLVLLAACTCALAGLYSIIRWNLRLLSSAAVHSWPPSTSTSPRTSPRPGSAPSTPTAAVTATVAIKPVAGGLVAVPGGRRVLDVVAELACGLAFGLGLAFSGMARPSKVLGFLSVGSFGAGGAFRLLGGWDPSLPFVMGGALLLALPAFQLVARGRLLSRPLLAERFSCPDAAGVDARLLLGAALFGAGWGTGGICPGPGLVTLLATADTKVVAFVMAMCAGMVIERVARDQPAAAAAAAGPAPAVAAAASCKALA